MTDETYIRLMALHHIDIDERALRRARDELDGIASGRSLMSGRWRADGNHMTLFSKQQAEPIVHPPVERCAYVRAPELIVMAHLDEYSSLFSRKRSVEHQVQVAAAGDWTAIRLPEQVHPWQLHNLAFWMLDCPDAEHHVIAVSAPAPNHPGYWLVRDPAVPDALCGWDDEGNGWTVDVPANDIVRPEPVPVSRNISCPSGFHNWRDLTVRLEDPGADMNPANEPTYPARKRLIDRYDFVY